jgi:TetR/AcrR family transcriptional regulator, transcriptional repressor for nem operon
MKRNPDQTRQTILEAALREIHRDGFQAASLSNILASTGLTKGALYHHFPNKLALGYALVDELLKEMVNENWLRPLETCEDPIQCLQDILKTLSNHLKPEDIFYGCPINNLALEMSPTDPGFRQRINDIYNLWRKGIADAFIRGQANGKVNKKISPLSTATFIIASLAGMRSIAKNFQSEEVLLSCGESIVTYLETLRS